MVNIQHGQMLKQGSLPVQFWDHYFILNDLYGNLNSNLKFFVDGMPIHSVINDKHSSANELNQDLNRINNWVFQWKMSFNPDPSK